MTTSPASEYFSRWLDRTMANAGISGKGLASETGLDEASISRWRRGRSRPGVDSCERLAGAVGVEPLRLAVTAGLLSSTMAAVEPLPMPSATAGRAQVRDQIMHIRGITDRARHVLLDAYDAVLREEDDGSVAP